MTTTTKPGKRWYTDVEVTVSVSGSELAENGWHHEDDCPARKLPPQPFEPTVRALASLHRQAHPRQPADPVLCREEPCRSLSIDQLRTGR